MAVLRVRQQHPGEKGPQCHGNTGQFHQPGRANHHQQRGGGRDFLQLGSGHEAKYRAQQVAPADYDQADAAQHLEQGFDAARTGGVGGTEQGNHCNQRDRRDVLKQQDGERLAAMRAGQFLAFCEQLQAEGGG
ncbi:hypothetical protein D3C76_965310 [compost metagenome]